MVVLLLSANPHADAYEGVRKLLLHGPVASADANTLARTMVRARPDLAFAEFSSLAVDGTTADLRSAAAYGLSQLGTAEATALLLEAALHGSLEPRLAGRPLARLDVQP